jgi:transcription initiation factor TFIIIB Brf1 subunit/transcription initiation factor TFIIB
VIDIPLEEGAEYRWFSNDSGGGGADPSRCSFPVNHLMPESSLGTIIINGRGSAVMNRIKRYHMWNMMPYRESTLWKVFEGLQVRASNNGIGSAVIEEAKELFAQLTASASCRGEDQRDSLLAACLWEALKRHGTPRMPKDIAEMFSVTMAQLTKGIKQFQKLSASRTTSQRSDTYTTATPKKPAKAASIPEEPAETKSTADEIAARVLQRRAIWQKTASRTTSYEDFIGPFLTNLSIPRTHASALESLVRHICEQTEELGIVPENTPPSLTASVIAFAAPHVGLTLDMAQIAKVCGISTITIQKCLKRLAQWEKKLVKK